MNRWEPAEWALVLFASCLPLFIVGLFAAIIVDLVT